MRKGIAVQTILLVVIGVIAAGIIVYMAYRYTGGLVISEAECNARLTEICTVCENINWKTGWGSFLDITNDCASYSKFSGFSGADKCNQMIDACRMFGFTTTTTS